MSRICVKNLPKYVKEDRLREFFSQKGEVTDAKLMFTKDGKTRQFAFIGFRTEQEAEEAIKYFNNSFMDTSRINCEIARKVGDPDNPRPWSRHSTDKHENSVEEKKKIKGCKDSKSVPLSGDIKKSETENDNNDPQFQEFLQVMQPRSKSKLWSNDALTPPSLDQNKAASTNKSKTKKGREEKIHNEVKAGGLDVIKGEEEISPDKQVVSDMDYFKSRVKKEWSDNDSESNEDEDTIKPTVSGGEVEESSVKENETPLDEIENEEVIESGRLFIRNLPYTATEEELEEHFSQYGSISQVHIVVDKETKRSMGFAYVLFALPESADRALEEMDNSIFQGRLLHVMPAKQKYIPDRQGSNIIEKQSSNTFKQKRDAEKKASEASGNTRAWNSLFMRPDTVVENIARKFGISKSEFLDKGASDLAVRIAMGETQVISETKKALSSAGVNISSLEEFATGKTDGLKRSNHVILVKNLPFGSSESELANMFGKFGSLEKVILPPTKTLALVLFLEPAEARAAFKGLAYKRYKDAPLYLEWAPANILSKSTTIGDNNTVGGEVDVNRALLEQQVEEITEPDVNPDRIESRSLYVKNLNFKTSDEDVKKHFTEHMKGGKILSVRVKKHVKFGKTLSMGFGFIEFDSVDTAVNVCRDLQKTVLDGHALILQLCHAKDDETVSKKVEDGKSSTKLIVRNVAFEATEKDLRQLFSPFGQIKSLRVPMKLANHRGFGFVEYVTKQEARNALEALSNTHLYGRHLVLERAKDGESLEELRARTAAQFTDSTKFSKKRKHMTVLDEGNIKFQRITD